VAIKNSTLNAISALELIALIGCGLYYNFSYRPHKINPVVTAAAIITGAPLPIATDTPIPTANPTETPSPTPKPKPSAIPTPTLKTYRDTDYQFKVSFPSTWKGVLKENTADSLEIYTISSDGSKIEIAVREGIWSNVKLELGPGSVKGSMAGKPALIRSKGAVYLFPSNTGHIFQVTVKGSSPATEKILKSLTLF
jgi:hypothetical protein